jgi:hypothetical protein
MNRFFRALTVFAGVLGFLTSAAAQNYPSRPITIIVPFPPGGATDVLARFLGERLRESLGQPVVIENVSGAAGTLGVGRAVRAPADGYTVSVGTSTTHMLTGGLYTLPFDIINDLDPVILIGSEPLMILGKKTLPADALMGLIAWLKANPDRASVGLGRRCDRPSDRPRLPAGDRDALPVHPLSWKYAGSSGSGQRADRFCDRALIQLLFPGEGRHGQSFCCNRQTARRRSPAGANHRRGGAARVLRLCVVRRLGPQGDAEGYRHQAQRRIHRDIRQIRGAAESRGKGSHAGIA